MLDGWDFQAANPGFTCWCEGDTRHVAIPHTIPACGTFAPYNHRLLPFCVPLPGTDWRGALWCRIPWSRAFPTDWDIASRFCAPLPTAPAPTAPPRYYPPPPPAHLPHRTYAPGRREDGGGRRAEGGGQHCPACITTPPRAWTKMVVCAAFAAHYLLRRTAVPLLYLLAAFLLFVHTMCPHTWAPLPIHAIEPLGIYLGHACNRHYGFG